MEVALVAIGGLIGVIAGGLSAYVTGRFNLQAAQVAAQTEHERVAAQSDRADQEHRQGVYHRFLNALSRIDAATAVSSDEFMERGSALETEVRLIVTLVTDARDQLNGIRLFGTEAVVERAVAVDELFSKAERTLQAISARITGPFVPTVPYGVHALLSTWNEHAASDEWQRALADLRMAMRAEIAP